MGRSGGKQQVAFPTGSLTQDLGTPYPSKVSIVTLRAGYKVCLFSQALSCGGSGAGGENDREKAASSRGPCTTCTPVYKLFKALPVYMYEELKSGHQIKVG